MQLPVPSGSGGVGMAAGRMDGAAVVNCQSCLRSASRNSDNLAGRQRAASRAGCGVDLATAGDSPTGRSHRRIIQRTRGSNQAAVACPPAHDVRQAPRLETDVLAAAHHRYGPSVSKKLALGGRKSAQLKSRSSIGSMRSRPTASRRPRAVDIRQIHQSDRLHAPPAGDVRYTF